MPSKTGVEQSSSRAVEESRRDGRQLLDCSTRHRFGGPQGEAADEGREAAEEDLVVGGEQVVGPGDGVAHRALAGWEVAGTAGEERQASVEAVEEGPGGEDVAAGGGEFDREREAVEAMADRGEGGGRVVAGGEIRADSPGALDEEADGCGREGAIGRTRPVGLGQTQRRHRQVVLAVGVQHRTAGDKCL
jgi:hypothetical protein